MPTVRRGERTLDVSPLPRGMKSAAATPASEGAGLERAKEDQGQTIGSVGAAIGRMGLETYAHVQDQERRASDETALINASNQLSEWKEKRLFDPDTGAYTLHGKAAFDLPEQIKTEFNELAGKIELGLSTPEQRQAFARLRSQEFQSLDFQVNRHVFGEVQQYRAGELKSLVANKANEAIQNALDPKLVDASLGTAVSAIRTTGKNAGLGEEAQDAAVRAVQTQVHVGVISTLLAQGKDQEASHYYAARESQIEADKKDDVLRALEEGTLRGQGQKQADAIIREGGTLTQQREKARAIEDPKLRDQVEQRLEHEAAVTDRAEREADEAAMKQGYDLLDNGLPVTGIPPALWTNYSGATRSAMRSYALQRAKGSPVETDLPTYYARMTEASTDPTAFGKRNLLEDRHRLDEGDWKQLVNIQASIKRQDGKATDQALGGFRTRDDILTDSLTQYGIDPKTKDPAQLKSVAQLRRMLDQQVADQEHLTGKKPTNQDIQSTLDKILSQNVTVPGSWWNIFPGGKSVSDTQQRVIDLTIEDVPAADRTQIESALRRAGRAVSNQTVLDLYLRRRLAEGK